MAEKQSKWRIFTAGIIRENPGYSRFHMDESAEAVKKAIRNALKRLYNYPQDRLVEQRQQKYLNMRWY